MSDSLGSFLLMYKDYCYSIWNIFGRMITVGGCFYNTDIKGEYVN